MGAKDHRERAESDAAIRCAILTVTDSKNKETDTSGKRAFEILQKYGHAVLAHEIVPNDRRRIADALERSMKEADLVVTIGGTGASRRDLTVEAVRPFLVKELPGFGEMFRALSAKEVGTAAILSRAVLGVAEGGAVVVSLPGSEGAVRLALEDILMNDLKHLVWDLRRY